MSLLARLFGGGKASDAKALSPAQAIQRLREVEEMLIKKQDFLEGKVTAELETAKKNGTKNKRVALAALKRKKRFENQLKQIDGTLTTIEFQREALENANTNTSVLQVMADAAKALKRSHADMDVDKVHELMDDVHEQQEIANEISEAISNPVAFGTDIDEQELLDELEALEEEEVEKGLLDVEAPPAAHDLPAVPVHTPIAAVKTKEKKQEDDDLAELAQWAS
ncbi:charged multivesicular body protein 4b-like [Tropilaelaps mercedesae]|uniref:Charged multivesicular body protein 4b-like n=1 Tax=Tropilaelaps mercedesae TaxID=418985 RepID=A0A1V9X900_9ACAR|nr:charged multivesicular body protein 4b-like [Tropilaelaps mercedesae]